MTVRFFYSGRQAKTVNMIESFSDIPMPRTFINGKEYTEMMTADVGSKSNFSDAVLVAKLQTKDPKLCSDLKITLKPRFT